MSRSTASAPFSILGGPLHQLGSRLGLVRGTNTVPLGFAIAALLWIPLAAPGLWGDTPAVWFSLSAIAVHVRLLAVIPLLFLCETWIAPRVEAFLSLLLDSEIVPPAGRPDFAARIASVARVKNSWVTEAACAVVAALLWKSGFHWLLGAAEAADLSRDGDGAGWAASWYLFVCLPVFRFLMLRWLWRLLLWWYVLWSVATRSLHLLPTHPDGAGGLGYLEVVHAHFIPLVLANSALQSASLAEELHTGTTAFEGIYPALGTLLGIDVLLFILPLFLVTPKLWACRVKGLSDYMMLGQRYVQKFDAKWARPDGALPVEPLLGTPDLQSLADLANSINVVRNMRIVPISQRLLLNLAGVAMLPVLPLFLFQYPLAELTQKFVSRLLGF